MGMSHQEFVTYLGRDKTEWSHLRAGRRDPSDSFVRAARVKAAEYGGFWLAALDDDYQRDVLKRVSVPQPAA